MSAVRKVGRREFLLRTGTAGAGLLLVARLEPVLPKEAGRFQPSVFLAIDEGGDVTVWVAKSGARHSAGASGSGENVPSSKIPFACAARTW